MAARDEWEPLDGWNVPVLLRGKVELVTDGQLSSGDGGLVRGCGRLMGRITPEKETTSRRRISWRRQLAFSSWSADCMNTMLPACGIIITAIPANSSCYRVQLLTGGWNR